MPKPSEKPVDTDRAMSALERAASAAEQGEPDRPIQLTSADELRALGIEELRKSLDRVMVAPHPDEGLDALLTGGVLEALFPEVSAMVGFGDGEWRHKDVWKHTKQVVLQADARLEVRWAALYHDVGKVKTRSFGPNGEVHFFGHAEVGARMFDRADRRENLFSQDPALKSSVRFLVLHHLRASQYDGSWTDSAVRRFARDMGDGLDDLMCLSRADITTKRPEKKRRGVALIDELGGRIAELAKLDAVRPPLPKGVGTLMMTHFGTAPSRRIGEIKRALEVAVETGELPAYEESEFYVDFLENNRARFGL